MIWACCLRKQKVGRHTRKGLFCRAAAETEWPRRDEFLEVSPFAKRRSFASRCIPSRRRFSDSNCSFANDSCDSNSFRLCMKFTSRCSNSVSSLRNMLMPHSYRTESQFRSWSGFLLTACIPSIWGRMRLELSSTILSAKILQWLLAVTKKKIELNLSFIVLELCDFRLELVVFLHQTIDSLSTGVTF